MSELLDFLLYEQYEQYDQYDQAIKEEEEEKEKEELERSLSCETNQSDPPNCAHTNHISERGIIVCMDCGEELCQKISHEKDWKYYGNGDQKHASDPDVVHIRKVEDRSIFKDVENLGFSEAIITKANKIYLDVTKGKIYRGNSRKAIVFACVFHAYKMSGKPQTHDKLIQVFSLKRKTGLKGLKHVNLYASRDSKLRTTYITPINLVEDIMEKFSANKDQKKEVGELYEKIKNKSSRLNRSRPQSVASGLVYYWIRLKKKEITLKEFAKKVNLSELTINKIAKEISGVLSTPEVI